MDIKRWKFKGDRSFGVMTNIQTFSDMRSLNVTWWPDLEWPGSEIFTECAENVWIGMPNMVARSAAVFFFLDICEKPEGLSKHPQPGAGYVCKYNGERDR